ncbi:response regulator transcription factor [Peptoniphilus stercorisuis]|uniref:DNA-binding response OmpR family regulator n=1 Tax=Peptoniphilus stercorisuis TaxID=1436965 RepID=A0ABS4KBW0_9FIRM|nr:response regulator transcription factor [Peptoniphilus stercorisuis]MBP2025263.1 DNA-binding response OmpR family regulator [Peptoniphilus stercorisuis]
MRKILIVEDDMDINNLLSEILKNNGYETDSAYTGREALLLLKMKEFDLVLLDLMMPNMTGEDVIEEIRKNSKIAIIVISAKSDKKTKIDVLKMGADDFIQKPFDIDDVLVRVEANIRRYRDFGSEIEEKQILNYKDIELNEEEKLVMVSGNALKLTPIEYEIIKLLMKNPNRIYSKETIYKNVWNDDYIYDADTINAHMSNLRNKLKKHSENDHIETIWGMGYRLK